jgi:carnitine O-acetyltransferase
LKNGYSHFFLSKEPARSQNATTLPEPQKVNFQYNEQSKAAIHKSEQSFDKFRAKFGHKVLSSKQYGSNFIKVNKKKKFLLSYFFKTVKLSPDAYVQMAIQWAYFRLYNKIGATYESAQTKKYAFGRTETGRSVTIDSAAFVYAMANPKATVNNMLFLVC